MPNTEVHPMTGEAMSAQDREQLGEIIDRIGAVEGQIGAMATDPRIGSALLRVTELERKINDGTSDPLLNEIVSRLAALEQTGSRPAADPRVDALARELAELREQARTASSAGFEKLTLRLSDVEARTHALSEDPRLTDLFKRLSALERGGNAARNDSSQRLEAVLERVSALETESQISADPRLAELGERLGYLEEKVRSAASEEVEELRARVAAIESRPAPEAGVSGTALEDMLSRVRALEQQVALGSESHVEDLQTRLTTLEEARSTSDPRFVELSARISAMEKAVGDGQTANARWSGLSERVDSLEINANNEPDPRIADILARVERIEQEPRELAGLSQVEELTARVHSLESRPDSAADVLSLTGSIEEVRSQVLRIEQQQSRAEQSAAETRESVARAAEMGQAVGDARIRLTDLDERLAQVEQIAAKSQEGISKLNPERFIEWTREMQAEFEELKQQVEQLREFGGGSTEGGGISLGAVQALGDRITDGLKGLSGGNTEVKALRNQMYFVYFTIGMVYAIGAFAGFVYLFNS